MREEKEFKLRYSVSCILYTELYSFHWAFIGRLVCATFIYIVGCFPFSLYLPQFGLRGASSGLGWRWGKESAVTAVPLSVVSSEGGWLQ